ncbi:hypothetical protein KC669_04550 [Candidatus Dojkabacteria bacterium]|uniref:Ribosomal RNA large subunit methyltransferase K/L-like methyltransferase domain-containing protein n=1 Tax=Candidatus Dojkabacteria bacterium TaxID=2099670 RepID=A0A955LC12_9BACT|nr:hypothetical protein [Candidatus Dojkabacteria bacterium]
MKLVIFGRNKEIARIELYEVLSRMSIRFSLDYEEDRYWIISCEDETNINFHEIIQNLAGTLRIVDIKQVLHTIHDLDLEQWDLYLPKKYNYAISETGLNEEERDIVTEHAKAFAKNTNSKAIFKNPKSSGKERLIDPSSYISWNLEDGVEYVYFKSKDGDIYSGVTEGCGNTKIFKMLDTHLPARRFTHGTSFRVARMMMNILDLKENQTLADPFCGTGTFLIEGLLQRLNVIGIDNDSELVNDSKQNLHWLKNEFEINNSSEVILGDAKKTEFVADGVIFEPYMGPFLKNIPSIKEAKYIWNELNDLYNETFANLSMNLKLGNKVVCILPDIPSTSGEIFKLDEKVFESNGFMYTSLPSFLKTSAKIKYDTPDGSKIIRHVYILEKV